MNSSARLVPRMSTPDREAFIITGETSTIGREPINDITLNDAEVSRRHARITFRDGAYQIEDLGSTNGTFVNGLRIFAATSLKSGDIVDFGETQRFTFMLGEANGVQTGVISQGALADPFAGAATVVDEPGRPTFPHPSNTELELEDQAPEESGGKRRWVLGCGCAALLFVGALIVTVFLLDALAPDFLWCTLLRPITDLLANVLGESVICP